MRGTVAIAITAGSPCAAITTPRGTRENGRTARNAGPISQRRSTVGYGTANEYNFEKLPNPPAYEPTRCDGCGAGHPFERWGLFARAKGHSLRDMHPEGISDPEPGLSSPQSNDTRRTIYKPLDPNEEFAVRSLTSEKGLIFRITHIANVPWILDHGLHCPDSPETSVLVSATILPARPVRRGRHPSPPGFPPCSWVRPATQTEITHHLEEIPARGFPFRCNDLTF